MADTVVTPVGETLVDGEPVDPDAADAPPTETDTPDEDAKSAAAAQAAAEDEAAREAAREAPRRSSPPPIPADAPPWESPGRPRNAIIGMIIVVALLGTAALVGWVLFKPSAEDGPSGALGEATGPCELRTVDELPGGGGEPVFGQTPQRQTVVVQTNLGTVTALLFGDLAPCGTASFANLAARGYYSAKACPDMTTAVTEPTLVLRCGEAAGQGGPGYRVRGEHPFSDQPVADALALVNDTHGLSGGEFAFVRGQSIPTNNLTVIGQVIDGFAVLDSIAAGGGGQAYAGPPPQPVTILAVTVQSALSPSGLPAGSPPPSGSLSPGTSPRPGSPSASPRSSRSPGVPFGRD
ncbi:hypothetical protein Afil01_59340 [Actinorhabdospora filicis]|uniref:PPIase cyclophilin-type domain-containing protein n=1 Tax=Actinorhabdospora filicis TaxID=1785913 RepID=A0A9W6W646_9ACTN|nr:hypothetical protein Afil01_59340 [Actinorhabdospora filicis]